jgi:hypothetical protein
MIRRGLVTPASLRETFGAIEPFLYRYPGVHPASFRSAVDDFLGRCEGREGATGPDT